MARQNSNRRPKPYDRAFRGTVKRRMALWTRVRAGLAEQRARGCLCRFFEQIFQRFLEHQNEEEIKIFIGFGGVKGGVRDRERRERQRFTGRTSPKGLAELSGMCRSSVIAASKLAVRTGVLMVVKGGGTRPDGIGIGGRGLANEYRLDGMPRPPAPLPEPEPERPQGLEKLGDIAARLPDPRRPRGP